MKRFVILNLALLTITGSFSACKKGENDPMLSLKSRRARVAGEYTMTNRHIVHQNSSANSSYSSITTSEYDGSTQVVTSTMSDDLGSQTNTSTYHYTLKATFKKDGSFEMVQTGESGETSTIKGTWSFLKKNKEEELKNKEAILLTRTSQTFSDLLPSTTTFNGIDNDVWNIDELRHKKMVLKRATSTEGNTGSKSSYESSITFTQN